MSENRKAYITYYTVIGLLAVGLYLLSFGPALWLVQLGSVSAEGAAKVYQPCLALEFHAPQIVQDSVMGYARLCRAGSALRRVRDVQSWQTYPVGDLAYRLVNDRRVDLTADQILDYFTSAIVPETWDEVGGIGRLIYDKSSRSLQILQTRTVHAAVASHLAELRALKRSKGSVRELDMAALLRITCDAEPPPWGCGGCLKAELLERAIIIGHIDKISPDCNWRLFSNTDELLAFLDRQPRAILRRGVFWSDSQSGPDEEVADRLREYCKEKNLDLFIEWPFKGNRSGMFPFVDVRSEVRASDSDYAL